MVVSVVMAALAEKADLVVLAANVILNCSAPWMAAMAAMAVTVVTAVAVAAVPEGQATVSSLLEPHRQLTGRLRPATRLRVAQVAWVASAARVALAVPLMEALV